MKTELCTKISKLVPNYFFEPDVFQFTQSNWDLGNSIFNKDESEVYNILLNSSLTTNELQSFNEELLKIKTICQEGDL